MYSFPGLHTNESELLASGYVRGSYIVARLMSLW